MNFKRQLQIFRQRNFKSTNPQRSGRQRKTDGLQFQKLESRLLLAGDVTVFIDNINLVVIGDSADNQIQIVGNRFGGATVIGLEDTTINGGDTQFVSPLPGLRNATIQLGGGGDSLEVANARFSNGVNIFSGAGNDDLLVRNSSIGSLNIQSGNGDDLLEIDSVWAINSSVINTQGGDDVIAIYSHAVGGDVSLFGGAGEDVLVADNLGMFGQLTVETGAQADQVLFTGDTFIGRDSQLNLGDGNDFLGILPEQNSGTSQIQRFTSIDAGSGDDNVALDAAVSTTFGAEITGSDGNDGYNNSGEGLSDSDVTAFEILEYDVDAARDDVFTRIAEAGIDPTLFGGTSDFLLGITNTSIPLNFTENSGNLAVDNLIELNGPSDTVVNSATVQIDGFAQGQDVLDFASDGNIVGNFDDTTGILTLTGDASLSDYQLALQSVVFGNASESPNASARTLVFQVNTATRSVTSTRTLNVFSVNDIPELTGRDTNIDFDQDLAELPLVLDDQVEISDLDNPTFESAAVRILNGLQDGDVLELTNPVGNLVTSFNAETGELAISGVGSIAEYQEALRSVALNTSNINLQNGTRTIRFEVFDGVTRVTNEFNATITASETIQVTASEGTSQFQELTEAAVVDSEFDINADNNDDTAVIDSATVRITEGFDAERDVLSFTPTENINGEFDQSTGTLSFSGTGTASDYEALLRTVTFNNTSFGDFDFSTANRVVEFTVAREGLNASSARTVEVAATDLTEEQLLDLYVEQNDLNPARTDSGLRFILDEFGTGRIPVPSDQVLVNYTGSFLNGDVFESFDGVDFRLTQVIRGWTEGLQLLAEGGTITLLIPSELAYGSAGLPPSIGPDTPLVFEVDLVSIL